MISRRCSICSINWPPLPEYDTCPQCGEPTSPMRHAEPIPNDEAERLAAHAAFEEYLEETGRA